MIFLIFDIKNYDKRFNNIYQILEIIYTTYKIVNYELLSILKY